MNAIHFAIFCLPNKLQDDYTVFLADCAAFPSQKADVFLHGLGTNVEWESLETESIVYRNT